MRAHARARLQPCTTATYGAVAAFSGAISGTVVFSQNDADPTQVDVYLAGLDASSVVGYPYHVHVLPVLPTEPACTRVLGHFDPLGCVRWPVGPVRQRAHTHAPTHPGFSPHTCPLGRPAWRHTPGSANTGAGYACNDSAPSTCEIGDLAGKHGTLLPPAAGAAATASYTDAQLMLHGPLSVIGRSVVVHAPNGTRLQCATIVENSNASSVRLHAARDAPHCTMERVRRSC